jgi:hypothetical protein
MNGYMLDTTVFNFLVNKETELSCVPIGQQLFVTHVQLNEIQNTRDLDRLDALLGMFTAIDSTPVPTASAIYGVSEFGESEYSSEGGLFESLLGKLNDKNKFKNNNVRDILIAETAIRRNLVLVTDDDHLTEVVRESGATVIRPNFSPTVMTATQ